MALMRWLGLQSDEHTKLRYEFHPEEAARMRQKLNDRPYAVMHPGSVLETKRWQARRYGELAGRLARRGLTMVLTAGPGEESWVSEAAREIEGAVIVLGLRIREIVELMWGWRACLGTELGRVASGAGGWSAWMR